MSNKANATVSKTDPPLPMAEPICDNVFQKRKKTCTTVVEERSETI